MEREGCTAGRGSYSDAFTEADVFKQAIDVTRNY